jgi:hypothetical protein
MALLPIIICMRIKGKRNQSTTPNTSPDKIPFQRVIPVKTVKTIPKIKLIIM